MQWSEFNINIKQQLRIIVRKKRHFNGKSKQRQRLETNNKLHGTWFLEKSILVSWKLN